MQRTIDCIKQRIGDFQPEIGIVLGSGLGDLADEYNEISIPYSEIEGFPTSTVQGHKGQLVFASINGKKITSRLRRCCKIGADRQKKPHSTAYAIGGAHIQKSTTDYLAGAPIATPPILPM